MLASHGARSTSVSGTPCFIFSMFPCGWKSSASRKSQPSFCAMSLPTVVFPAPVVPMTRMNMTSSLREETPVKRLGAAQDEQRNFRWYSQANRRADCAQAAVHVNRGVRTLQGRSVQKFLRRDSFRRSKQRAHIEAGNVVRD